MPVPSPSFEGAIASLKPREASAPNTPPLSPALHTALQAAMNKRMAQMRDEFEASMKQIVADAEAIQQSDLVTLRISAGEEVILYRTDDGNTQDLLDWLLKNGWHPIG